MAEEVPQNNANLPDANGGNGQGPVAAQPQNPLPTYSLIGDRYQVIDILGRGGMGTVLKARHIKLNKLVAIKVLNPAILVDESSKLRFEQEAKACGKLTHPNLIAVFDYGFTPDDEPYLAMEYVQGESLEALIESNGPLNKTDFVRIFSQLCKPLQFIHKNGIIHRDLKPSNIMLHNIEDEQYVKLLDFGIAKVLPDQGAASQHLTATGMVYGSPVYMSPEQCRGKNVDARSDIYSLGCVMYQCVSGHAPFTGENILQTLFMHANDPPPPLPPAVDPAVTSIILKCLQKLPADRYQSPNDLLAEINKLGQGGAPSPDFSHARQSAVSLEAIERPGRLSGIAGGGGMMSSRLLQQGGQRPSGTGASSSPGDSPGDLLNRSAAPADAGAKSARIRPFDSPSQASDFGTNGSAAAANIRSARFGQEEEPPIESRPKLKLRGSEEPPKEPKQLPAGMFVAAGIAAVGLACFVAFRFGAPAFKQLQFSMAMQQAEQAFNSGKSHWPDAEAQFSHAYTLANEDDHDALGKIRERLGDIKLEERMDSDAINDFSDAIAKLTPHKDSQKEAYLDAIYGMAETLSQQGSNEQAEEYFAKARSWSADFAPAAKQAEILCASGQNAKGYDLGKALQFYDQGIAQYEKANPVPQDKLAEAWVASAEAATLEGQTPEPARRAQQALQICAKVTDVNVKSELEARCAALLQTGTNNGVAAPVAQGFPNVPAATVALPPVDTSNPAVAIEQLKLQQAQVQLEDLKTRQAAFSNLSNFVNQHNAALNQAITPQLQRLNGPGVFAPPPVNNYAPPPTMQPVHQAYAPPTYYHAAPSAPAPVRAAPPAPVRSTPPSSTQQTTDQPFWR